MDWILTRRFAADLKRSTREGAPAPSDDAVALPNLSAPTILRAKRGLRRGQAAALPLTDAGVGLSRLNVR